MMKSKTEKRGVSILLVDDHPVIREGLKQLIHQERAFCICGEAESASQALEAVAAQKPDLAIIDISLKNSNGIELIKTLRIQYPKLLILIFSMYDESLYAERALRAGAQGYLMKQEVAENILKAIHQILNGGIYLSETMSTKMLQHLVGHKLDLSASPLKRLSDRELEVFQSIGQGDGTRQIAKSLHLSVKTIESYRATIKEKLNLKNAMELVQHAVHWYQNGKLG